MLLYYTFSHVKMKKVWMIILILLFIQIGFLCEGKKIPDPYKVLGIGRDANEEQIKTAFKKRSRKYHPDRNKKDPRTKQKFSQVVNAYELLKDPEKKRIYDQSGGEDPHDLHQGGGFGFSGGYGINMEDIMRGQGFGGFQQGRPGGFQQGHPGGF